MLQEEGNQDIKVFSQSICSILRSSSESFIVSFPDSGGFMQSCQVTWAGNTRSEATMSQLNFRGKHN